MFSPYANKAKILLLALAVVCLVVSAGIAAQPDPSLVGQWSFVPDLPYFPVHLSVLPTGEVMIWPGDVAGGGVSGNDPRLWDPVTQSTSLLAKPGYDVFCSGHSFLADGQLLVTGGHIQTNVGLPNASVYNPFTDTWTAVPNMNAGRWYPTNTTLANGDVLVVSGSIDLNLGSNPLPQVFEAATGTWRNLTNAQLSLDLYPRMHLAPNGKVFNSGPSQVTRYLDTSGAGSWTAVANRILYRDYGSSVLYDNGKVFIMGGGDPPTNTAEVIDLNAASPAWRTVAPMVYARRQLNATMLPDGNILVNGGTSGAGWSNPDFPIYPAEMWNPATETWTTMASAQIPRLYHSIAALLPDGRVLTTGGNGYPQAEIYEPPYLFKGGRPTITSAPASVVYGQTFFVQSPDAVAVTQVNWIRLPSVTHAFNTEQRINRLSFSQAAGGLNVVAPANPNLAPVGYYMLFILNGNGVPSVARIVRIGNTAGGPSPVPIVSSLSPDNALVGGPAFTLTVNGSNFLIGSVVQWNGTQRPTTFVSGTQLTAAISANDLAVAGAASVAVVNPAPGGGISNALTFRIDPSTITTGLVAAYGFDEGSGTTVGDSSGNGHTGAISGATWTVSGKYSGALSFNGTSSYVSVSNPNLPTGDFTWSAWISPNRTDGFRTIMESAGLDAHPGGLEVDIDTGRIVIYSNGGNPLTSAAIIPTGVWSHVALTRSGSAIKLYISGNQDPNTGTDGAAHDFGGCALTIGMDYDSDCTGNLNGYFEGIIDEIRIYSRALSQAEIQSYMNTPITPPGPDTTPPDTNITATPANPSNNSSANFSFTSTETGSIFECQLDGGSFGACTSPKSYTGLSDASHIFYVRAIDAAGNVDPTPASYTWTSDATPPTVSIVSPTSSATYATGSSLLTLSGTANDNNAVTQVTWSNNRGGSGTASGTTSWTAGGIVLQGGSNILTVTARDAAGNTAPATLTVTYTAPDTTPPVRSNGAPSGTLAAGTTQTTLSLTTNENAVCRFATSAGVAYGSMPNTFTTTGGTTHSTTVSGLTGGSYSYFVRCQDSSGNANPDDFAVSFSVAQLVTTVTAFPTGAVILTGTLNSGAAASLNSDDNVYFAVNSTTSGTRTTSWYGAFTGVTSALSNLRVNYKGNNSASCTQTIAIWRWTDSTWVQLDSRSVSTTEIAVNNLTPSGTLANYVSTTGNGELRVRVQCTRTGNFIARGDLMSIVYNAPVGPPPPDTTPPVRSNGAPSGTLAAGTTQTTLSLMTNENSSCRYATSAGVTYGSMPNVFTTTGGTTHSTTVGGLTDGGSYSYFVRCQDTSSNANPDDFVISFSVALPGTQVTYQASADFSSTQGFRNWYYLYGAGTQMAFVGANWQGNETYLTLYPDGGHPGNLSDAIRRWKSPQAGSVNITGNAFDIDTTCGAGASVYIKKNSTILWQQAIVNGNTVGVSFNLATTVAAGDNIDFGINRGADNVWDCDLTGFDPTILFTP
jgi:hypothetical protein